MKITNRMEIEIKNPENIKIIRDENQLIIYDENIIVKFKIFTEKYINELLQEGGFIV